MVVETWDKNQFSYLYVLYPFIKLTRLDPTRIYIYVYCICIIRLISETVSYTCKTYQISALYSLETIHFSAWLKFCQFSAVFIITFNRMANFKLGWFIRKISFRSMRISPFFYEKIFFYV